MTRFKFRAWNGLVMEYRVLVGALGAFYVEGMDPKDAASISPFNTKLTELTPVMQFTGLLDKNGKEIYEGDFLGEDEKAEVKFENGAFRVRGWVIGEWLGKIEMRGKDTSIIGNIYENPELLKWKTH